VIPYWTWAWAGLWRVLLSTPDRPPAVVVVHNLQDHDAGLLQRLAANLVLGRCDGAFAHAAVLAEVVRRKVAGLAVVSHPLPPCGPAPAARDRAEARRRLDLPEDGRLALFLGLVRPYKGVDRLVEAAALPQTAGWRFVVAGEPWGREGVRLADLVARLGVSHRVLLRLQWVPEADMDVYLAAADVVVLPYRHGSQSAVAPLALAAGVPVVAPAVGGLPEVVVDRVNGRLAGGGRPEEIAGVLAGLDEGELARLAGGARRSAASLTWDGYAAAMEGLLARVAG
jgi:glycosyltransferase involved in cell wall biosynthesis